MAKTSKEPGEAGGDFTESTHSGGGTVARDLRKEGGADSGEGAGQNIGPYRLLQVIGEGGFGEVWLAERREPHMQRVALKIIKPGMDSRAVVARFEQERQALAVMDHPNIARVFDAGTTPAAMGSRPYFVMEHVKGEPITMFCDRLNLSIRERLELFIPVCEAVQHAHTKGVIHRDIKPSNILVSPGDGASERGVPKVIDFGVAKAISQSMTEKTIFTEQGMLIGTPEYMSPEQAEMGATDIDTRTDVYSLGVLLYELLTGVLPFDRGTLRCAALDEIRRIIREVEPPKPSTRLTGLGDEGLEVAKRRQAERDALVRQLRRELEWVPLMAMRKERDARYRTPLELADDVRRYLRGEVLLAGPEGAGYRVRKFIKRNRGTVAAVAAVLLALVAGLATTLVQRNEAVAQRAEAERQKGAAEKSAAEATEQKHAAEASAIAAAASESTSRRKEAVSREVTAFLNERLLGAADPDRARGREVTVLEVAERAIEELSASPPTEPEVEFEVRLTLSELMDRLYRPEPSRAMAESALLLAERVYGPESLEVARVLEILGHRAHRSGSTGWASDRSIAQLKRCVAIRSRLLGPTDPLTLRPQADLNSLLSIQEGEVAGDLDPALLAIVSVARGKGEAPSVLRTMIRDRVNEAAALWRAGKKEESITQLREWSGPVEKSKMFGGSVSMSIAGFALLYSDKGAHDAAACLSALSVRVAEDRSAGPSIELATTLGFACRVAEQRGDLDTAEDLICRCLRMLSLLGLERHPGYTQALGEYGRVRLMMGKPAEANGLFTLVLERIEARADPANMTVITTMNDIGLALQNFGSARQSVQLYRRLLVQGERVFAVDSQNMAILHANLAGALSRESRQDEAEMHYLKALGIERGVTDRDTVNANQLLISLANCEAGLGHLEDADRNACDAVCMSERMHPEGSARCAQAMAVLAKVRQRQGNREDARRLAAEAERMVLAFEGPGSLTLKDVMAIKEEVWK